MAGPSPFHGVRARLGARPCARTTAVFSGHYDSHSCSRFSSKRQRAFFILNLTERKAPVTPSNDSIRFGLAGRVAIVTGASQGIGEACARRFAQEGAQVVIADVADARGQALADELKATYVHCDVGD